MHPPSKRDHAGSSPAGGSPVPHHTKDKGDIGVLKAQADLAVQGCVVLLPLTEHAPFDLVIYRDRAFQRIQVKYRSCNRRGCLEVRFHSIWSDRRGVHRVPMEKQDIDIVCVYCPDTDECYYSDPVRFRRSVSLRLKPTRNNQRSAVKQAIEYRKLP
jgi:hypothetical protein